MRASEMSRCLPVNQRRHSMKAGSTISSAVRSEALNAPSQALGTSSVGGWYDDDSMLARRGSSSENQVKACSPSVSRYGKSPMGGKRVLPINSSGARPL